MAGPALPVEFARVSRGDRLTLVLVAGNDVTPLQVLWAEMCCRDAEHARRNLATREGVEANIVRSIPMWPTDGASVEHWNAIDRWAKMNQLDFVVWTALRSGFPRQRGRMLSEAEALAYLRTLQAGARAAAAEEYIRRTPPQIATAYRGAIENALGWTYDGSKTDLRIIPP